MTWLFAKNHDVDKTKASGMRLKGKTKVMHWRSVKEFKIAKTNWYSTREG